MKPFDLSQFMLTLSQAAGAGAVGFNAGNTYAAGTVGLALKNAGVTIAGLGTMSTVNSPAPVANGGTGLTTMTANAIYKGNGTSAPVVSNLSDDGTNIVVGAAGRRFQADFSNVSTPNRFTFQSSVANGATALTAIPNGTSQFACTGAVNASSATNCTYANFGVDGAKAFIDTGAIGSGAVLPLSFIVNGTDRLRIETNGNIVATGTAQRFQADFSSATNSARLGFQTSAANGPTALTAMPSGTGVSSSIGFFNKSDVDNGSYLSMWADGTICGITADKTGTGTPLPMAVFVGGGQRQTFLTSGNIGFHTNTPNAAVDVNGSVTVADGAFIYTGYNGTTWDGGAVRSGIQFAGGDQSMHFYVGNASGMALDSAKNLTVRGTTIYTGNTAALWQHDGTNVYFRPVNAGSSIFVGVNNSNVWLFNSSGHFYPILDGVYNCGVIGGRWANVCAANGTIVTSDARIKKWRGPLTPEELAAAKEIAKSIGIYQRLDSIEEKGEDGARLHTGVQAQIVGEIMTSHALDPHRYGFFCWDEWEETVYPGGGEGVPDIVRPAGDSYSIRYDELNQFLIAAQEQRIAALEALL